MHKHKTDNNLAAERYYEDIYYLEEAGIYYFNGEVDEDSTALAVEFIMKCNLLHKDEIDEIKLLINTVGGDIYHMWGLIETIKSSQLPVTTIGMGLVASAGVDIFIAGDYRICTPNTIFMSHQNSDSFYGKEHELYDRMKEIGLFRKITKRHYLEHTKVTLKQFEEMMNGKGDFYFDANTAKKLGVVDKIQSKIKV